MAAELGTGVSFVQCGEEPEEFPGLLDLKRAVLYKHVGYYVNISATLPPSHQKSRLTQ